MENGSKEWLAAQINQARTELTQLRIQLGIDPNDSIPGLESSQPNKNTDTRPITATSSQDKEPSEYDIMSAWKELVDKNTGRTYYVNTITKKSQWKKPTLEATTSDAESTNAGSKEIKKVSKSKFSAKEPNSPRRQQVASDQVPAEGEQTVRPVERFSRRISTQEMATLKSSMKEAAKGSSSHSAPKETKEAKIARYRKEATSLLPILTATGRMSVGRIDALGSARRTGFLMKQSKLLGRWRKRYFILSSDSLEYYDDENLTNGKEAVLCHDTSLSYTSKECCFTIKGLKNVDGSATDDWILMSDDELVMDDWIAAIYAHIHVKYKKELKILHDFWDEGEVEVSFWKVPNSTPDLMRRPVGIRTVPFVNGPRTNEGVYPGDTVEVVQVVKTAENTFLRLADDRGWIFQMHPTEGYELVTRVNGKYLVEGRCYRYPMSQEDHLNIFYTPSGASEVIPTLSIAPGTVIATSCVWMPDDPEEYPHPVEFVKLEEHKAWLTVQDLDTRDILLERV